MTVPEDGDLMKPTWVFSPFKGERASILVLSSLLGLLTGVEGLSSTELPSTGG